MSETVQNKRERSLSPWDIWLLVVAVVITFVARVWGIGSETAWWDEVFGLWQSEAESFGEYWTSFYGYDPTTTMAPVYFLGQFCWSRVFGASVISLRLFSVFLSCLTVIPLFFIGRRMFGLVAGFVACLCFAFALPHIFYAQEIRHHVLVSTIGAFSVWSFLIALDKNQRRWWVLHFVVNLLMLWSSIMTVFMFAVEGVFLLLFYRRPFSRFAIWVAAHTALLASILLWVMIQAVEKPFWLAPPTVRELVNAVVVMVGGRFSNESPTPYLLFPFSLEVFLVGFFFACTLVVSFCAMRRDPEKPDHFRAVTLLIAWFVLPMILLFACAVLYKPVFLYRYLLYASFPLYLFVGAAIGMVKKPSVQVLLVGVLLAVFGYQHTVRLGSPFRPDYRAATTHLLADTTQSVTGAPAPLLVLKKFANGLPLQYLGIIDEARIHYAYGSGDLHAKSVELVVEHGVLWVMMWRWDRMAEFEAHLQENGVTPERFRFGGMPPLFLYRLALAGE